MKKSEKPSHKKLEFDKDGKPQFDPGMLHLLLTGGRVDTSSAREHLNSKNAAEMRKYQKVDDLILAADIANTIGSGVVDYFAPGLGTAFGQAAGMGISAWENSVLPSDEYNRQLATADNFFTPESRGGIVSMATGLAGGIKGMQKQPEPGFGLSTPAPEAVDNQELTQRYKSPTFSPDLGVTAYAKAGGLLLNNMEFNKTVDGLIEVKGPKHFEEGSLGVEFTKSNAKAPTYVEGGEVIDTDENGEAFVYTNSSIVPNEIVPKYTGKKSNKEYTYAQLASEISKDIKANPNNPISINAHRMLMASLKADHLKYVPESRPENMGAAGLNNAAQASGFGKYGGDMKSLSEASSMYNMLIGGGDPDGDPTGKPQFPLPSSLKKDMHAFTKNPTEQPKMTLLSHVVDPQVSTPQLNEGIFIALIDAAKRSGIPLDSLTFTSMMRLPGNPSYTGNRHSKGEAIDLGFKGTDGDALARNKPFVDWITTDPDGKQWAKDHNIYLLKESDHWHIQANAASGRTEKGKEIHNQLAPVYQGMKDQTTGYVPLSSEIISSLPQTTDQILQESGSEPYFSIANPILNPNPEIPDSTAPADGTNIPTQPVIPIDPKVEAEQAKRDELRDKSIQAIIDGRAKEQALRNQFNELLTAGNNGLKGSKAVVEYQGVLYAPYNPDTNEWLEVKAADNGKYNFVIDGKTIKNNAEIMDLYMKTGSNVIPNDVANERLAARKDESIQAIIDAKAAEAALTASAEENLKLTEPTVTKPGEIKNNTIVRGSEGQLYRYNEPNDSWYKTDDETSYDYSPDKQVKDATEINRIENIANGITTGAVTRVTNTGKKDAQGNTINNYDDVLDENGNVISVGAWQGKSKKELDAANAPAAVPDDEVYSNEIPPYATVEKDGKTWRYDALKGTWYDVRNPKVELPKEDLQDAWTIGRRNQYQTDLENTEAQKLKDTAEYDANQKASLARVKKAQALRNTALISSASNILTDAFSRVDITNPNAHNIKNPFIESPISMDPIIAGIDRQVNTGVQTLRDTSGNPNAFAAGVAGVTSAGATAASNAAFQKQTFDADQHAKWAGFEMQKDHFNSQSQNNILQMNQANVAAKENAINMDVTSFTNLLNTKGYEDLNLERVRQAFPYDPLTGEFTGNTGMLDSTRNAAEVQNAQQTPAKVQQRKQ